MTWVVKWFKIKRETRYWVIQAKHWKLQKNIKKIREQSEKKLKTLTRWQEKYLSLQKDIYLRKINRVNRVNNVSHSVGPLFCPLQIQLLFQAKAKSGAQKRLQGKQFQKQRYKGGFFKLES